MLSPNVTLNLKDSNPSIKRYKTIADEFKMSHFIVTGNNFLKIGKYPQGPTVLFEVLDFQPEKFPVEKKIYATDPLITYSGDESNLINLFRTLSQPPKIPSRTINFHFDEDQILIRHYKIITEEDDNIKVGLKDIGPSLTLKIKKIEDSFFE
jgi:U3 small nucleolar ribonucleoprotein protein IMP4